MKILEDDDDIPSPERDAVGSILHLDGAAAGRNATMSAPLGKDSFHDEIFQHEALFYAGADELVDQATDFIRDSLAADEPILVVVVQEKLDRIRDALGSDARDVLFADMGEIGRNPGRIISRWRDFLNEYAVGGTHVRGIGEPIWAGRSPAELVESQRHESLINLAFRGAPGWILCPYDTAALAPDVIDEAFRSHPRMFDGRRHWQSDRFDGHDVIARPFDRPLAAPPSDAVEIPIALSDLDRIREFVTVFADGFGLAPLRVGDAVLAVNEIATNSLRHGRGSATLKAWIDRSHVVFEVSDLGTIAHPLAGRLRPASDQVGGHGLWLVNQLCDLVQVRAFDSGAVVRIQMLRSVSSS